MQHRILIVEDEAVVALDIQGLLEEFQYSCVGIAESGEAALRLARAQRPDLALMDIKLKGAMDGIEVADVFHRELGIPVVFLTAYSDSQTVERAARTAPYGYLTKPFRPTELQVGIEVALYKARMERQLRDSERWFASTLRCVQDGVVITEPDARVRFMNRAAEELTGWSCSEAVGKRISEVLRFGAEGRGDSLAERALSEGKVVGIEHALSLLNRQGRQVAVDESAAPVNDEQGERVGAVVVLRDVSERLNYEERLQASEQRFREAFDVAPLGMALLSLNGRFIQVNEALCKLLDCDADWLRQQRNDDVSDPNDLAHEQRRLQELLASHAPVIQFEKKYRRKSDAGIVWALVSASVLREVNQPVCYLYQINDLTDRKKAAEQLAAVAAEQLKLQAAENNNRMKSEFLSLLSHELRTPLNAVLGYAELLKEQGQDARTATATYIEHMLQACGHLKELIDDVLDLQQILSGKLRLQMGREPLDAMVTATNELLGTMATKYNVTFENEVPHGLYVRADKTRLRQVLLNLGSNAVKYNQPGGKVVWRAKATPTGRVELSVEDSGVGIPSEELEHLFKPFDRLGKERSTIPGTGLGLVISRSLCEAMNAKLTITSEVGVGTRACVELVRG